METTIVCDAPIAEENTRAFDIIRFDGGKAQKLNPK